MNDDERFEKWRIENPEEYLYKIAIFNKVFGKVLIDSKLTVV